MALFASFGFQPLSRYLHRSSYRDCCVLLFITRGTNIKARAGGLFSDRGDNCAADDDADDVEEMKYKREMRLIFFFNFVYFRTFLHL
jgi:hypothetical protein